MVVEVKGIRFDFEDNSSLEKLLRSYRRGVRLYLEYLRVNKKNSLTAVNSVRKQVMVKTGLSGANSVKAGNDALGIYRAFRRSSINLITKYKCTENSQEKSWDD